MITVVCANTGILWVLPTASKLTPVRIIRLFITPLNNGKHPYKRLKVDESGDLEN